MSVLVVSESKNEPEELLDDVEEGTLVESPRADERANVPVSVVTERFLRAIVDRVPLDRIEELHLFAALRQGTIETGIAVVAARVIMLEEATLPAPLELQLDAEDSSTTPLSAAVAPRDDEYAMDALPSNDSTANDSPTDQLAPDDSASNDSAYDDSALDDSPYADEPVQLKLVPTSDYAPVESLQTDVAELPAVEEPLAHVPEPRVRHTVYTARYRLVVKGPERGRWEMDVVDEADAPLLAVETVVRGVQRRAGEETATVRYDASQLARVLRLPPPG